MRHTCKHGARVTALFGLCIGFITGCSTAGRATADQFALRAAVERYRKTQGALLASAGDPLPGRSSAADKFQRADALTLCSFGQVEPRSASQPATRPAAQRTTGEFLVPDGYWRQDVWHQMGHEAKLLATHDFWEGFETSYWDVENILVLAAAMGASVTLRETGVDDAIRRRTDGNQQLDCFDEPIQILGNPATHFAGAGALWLVSTATKDVEQHEVARTLVQALAVNGVSTVLLKTAANTRNPEGDRHAWPSGHTSSSFTVAAVLNEYYGPWVGIPSLALAGLVGYQRIDSREHDFSDVVFGGMLGFVIGTSIAREEKADFPELFGMKVLPYHDPYTGAAGLALYKRW